MMSTSLALAAQNKNGWLNHSGVLGNLHCLEARILPTLQYNAFCESQPYFVLFGQDEDRLT